MILAEQGVGFDDVVDQFGDEDGVAGIEGISIGPPGGAAPAASAPPSADGNAASSGNERANRSWMSALAL